MNRPVDVPRPVFFLYGELFFRKDAVRADREPGKQEEKEILDRDRIKEIGFHARVQEKHEASDREEPLPAAFR